MPHRFRVVLLRSAGAEIGENVLLFGGLRIHGTDQLSLANDVFVNWDCYLDISAPISIATGVRIGNHVRIVTSTHQLGHSARRAGPGIAKSVHIGEGVWIGAGVTILPGVSIARGCVIAAGAVVTMTTDEDGLYAGVPARRIKSLPTETTLAADLELKVPDNFFHQDGESHERSQE